jgi:hypothetical protein
MKKYNNRNQFLDIINELDLKEGCEVGVYGGAYSMEILNRTTNNFKLHLIDTWKHLDNYDDISNLNDEDFEILFGDVKQKVNKFSDRVVIHRNFSEKICNEFKDSSLGFVYLDTNHSYDGTKKDINLWYNKVRSGGVFSGHDYLDGNTMQGDFGVKQAVDEFIKSNNLELKLTYESDFPSWYIIKPINIVLYCTKNYLQNSLN